MSFNRSYAVGDRIVAVVPCLDSSGHLSSCLNGNSSNRRYWSSSTTFVMLETAVQNVHDRVDDEDNRVLDEVVGAAFGAWSPYWTFGSSHLRQVLHAIFANEALTADQKKFIAEYSVPRVIASGSYTGLLSDLAAAVGVLDYTPRLQHADTIKQQARSLGIVVSDASATAPERRQLEEDTADNLDSYLIELSQNNPAEVSDSSNVVRPIPQGAYTPVVFHSN